MFGWAARLRWRNFAFRTGSTWFRAERSRNGSKNESKNPSNRGASARGSGNANGGSRDKPGAAVGVMADYIFFCAPRSQPVGITVPVSLSEPVGVFFIMIFVKFREIDS